MPFGPSSSASRACLRLAGFVILLAGSVLCSSPQSQAQQVTPAPAANAVRILSPKPGERIANNFVQVKYELATAASASSSPTYQLRLDDRDPVHTTDQQQTFTGLTLGKHNVSIEVLDANNTPVAGTRSEVQFTIVNPSRGEKPA